MVNQISGCFYLDACVVFSELLNENVARMNKFRKDVKDFQIPCYISQTVVSECEKKIKKTIEFLGNVLSNAIIGYLEKIGTINERDLATTPVSNADLHIIRNAFLEINKNVRMFDLLTDPFQAVEEWIVDNFEIELKKPNQTMVINLLTQMTKVILKEINNLESSFETLVQLETSYILQSDEDTNPLVSANLVNNNIHQPDADHISVITNHQKNKVEKAIFLTFDYKTILVNWVRIQQGNHVLRSINCCDPIYGLSFLR